MNEEVEKVSAAISDADGYAYDGPSEHYAHLAKAAIAALDKHRAEKVDVLRERRRDYDDEQSRATGGGPLPR